MCPSGVNDMDPIHETDALQAMISPTQYAGSVPTMLIVDDDPVVRSLMRDALEDEGFDVIEAQDGVEACRRCDEAVPSLVIVDVVMPNMDGFEVCRELRRRAETKYIPILMATSLDHHVSIIKAFESGATDFISKPLNWPILNQRIRYMLRGAETLENLRQNQESLRAANELEREQRERLEAALDHMSQGLCMFDSDGRLIISNRRFCDIYQLAPMSAVPGRSMIEVLKNSPLFANQAVDAPMGVLAEHVALVSRRDSAVLTFELAGGRSIVVTHEPMRGGGFVDTFTDVSRQCPAGA
jgi:response regulator RpfG family c-di-GMP phosphodiesterase